MFNQFLNILISLVDIPDEQINLVRSVVKTRPMKKGEYYVVAGEIPNSVAFNVGGLFAYHYSDALGNEFIKGFIPYGYPVCSYTAMTQRRESYFSIRALEDSTLMVLAYDDWKYLLNADVCWKNLNIALLEIGYRVKENRERDFLILEAEERYKKFLVVFPDLEARVKQHQIASYLGITPVALCRIRKKMGVTK